MSGTCDFDPFFLSRSCDKYGGELAAQNQTNQFGSKVLQYLGT